MNRLRNYPEVRRFLQSVCEHVRAREAHRDIEAELAGHIAETAESLMREGMREDEAIRQAVRRMGDPALTGKQLHRIHRPRIDWGMIVLLAVFVGLGLLAMGTVEAALQERVEFHFLSHKIRFACLGIAAALSLWFFDYRKLKAYSAPLFGLTIFLMLLALKFGASVNGTVVWRIYGSVSVDIKLAALFLLLVCLAGMRLAREWSKPETVLQFAVRCALPALLFMKAGSLSLMVTYLAGFAVLFWMTRKSNLQFMILPLAIACGGLIVFGYNHIYLLYRLSAYLHPYGDPDGSGYMYVQSIEAIRSAGWAGHGFAAPNDRLPYIYSTTLFTYMLGDGDFHRRRGRVLYGEDSRRRPESARRIRQMADRRAACCLRGSIRLVDADGGGPCFIFRHPAAFSRQWRFRSRSPSCGCRADFKCQQTEEYHSPFRIC